MSETKNTSHLKNNLNPTKNELEIYPNPANNELNVETNSSDAIKSIVVYNMQGMKIKEINLANNLSKYILENEGLNSGNYFIRVITEQTVYNKQFIIAR